MGEAEIRHAESGDADEIRKVAEKSWKDTYGEIISESSIEKIMDEWYDIEDLQKQASDPMFYVAELEGAVVGMVHSTVKDGRVDLHRIYLDPKHQRKGIGSALYTRIEQEARKKAEKMRLEVLSGNQKGLSFYKSKGFEEIREEEIELHGEKVRQKVMEKELEETDE